MDVLNTKSKYLYAIGRERERDINRDKDNNLKQEKYKSYNIHDIFVSLSVYLSLSLSCSYSLFSRFTCFSLFSLSVFLSFSLSSLFFLSLFFLFPSFLSLSQRDKKRETRTYKQFLMKNENLIMSMIRPLMAIFMNLT